MSAIVDNQIQVRRYDLGQPFVRREQRMAFEAIHRTLAQTWSEAMTPQLPAGTALEFEGLDFAAFASASLDRSPCAQLTLFSIGEAVVPAFLMISGALARSLVNGKLGLKASGADQDATPFTGIEASVAREAMRTLLARLGEDYQAAGLGAIGNVRRCDNLVEGVQLAPEEPLALLTFGIRGASAGMRVLLALGSTVVNSLMEHEPTAPAPADGRDAVIDAVRRFPIDIDIVLGRWKLPLRELMQLREGEKIILPDGEDAWLSSRGVRIRRASVEISGERARVEIRGRTVS